MKQILLIASLLVVKSIAWAQIPTGYYDTADGLTGYSLKSELHNIIDDHNDRGYGALWDLYETSDVRTDGKVWEMYSDCDFEFVTDQDSGSGGTTECDVFNREHSFPKSWFNDASPMHNDPFHVIPSDKKVNSVRGNFAYGETNSATYTSLNGSKLGANAITGYSGTIFEPADEYKGDLARGYLYMATRYEDVISGWENNNSNGNAMLDGSSDQVYETWALEMLIEWHEADPVSQKEIDRNEAIYDFQGNRNPFIDHPEWVTCIWNNECGTTPDPILTITESITDFGNVAVGESSAIQNYTIEGSNLTDDILIEAPTHFEISLTNNSADFTTTLTLTPETGTVTTTTIYVRFTPQNDANGVLNGNIIHSTTGVSDELVAVSGTETSNTPDIPMISFNGNATVIPPSNEYQVVLNADQVVNDDLYLEVSIASTLNLTYGINGFTTQPAFDETLDIIPLNISEGESSTTFTLTFGDNINAEVTKKIVFQLQSGPDYEIGDNNTFELIINPGEGNTVVTGLPTNTIEEPILFYPNPAVDHITLSKKYHKLIIYNMNGGVVKEKTKPEVVMVNDLKDGIYYIHFINKSTSEISKLIVTH